MTRYEKALNRMSLPDIIPKILALPEQIKRVALPLKTDAGGLEMFSAWRVRFSSVLGPTKGGVRFHPSVNEANLVELSQRLLMKCAANNLPHGGAAGGVAVDPKRLSGWEKERLARAYVSAFHTEIGQDSDILSPDIGTDAQTMGVMLDQLRRDTQTSTSGAINGKPMALGGIPGRPEATARGAAAVLRAVLESRGESFSKLRFAVQGFGSAGGHLAVQLQRQGLVLVAASDSSGGFYHPDGFDAEFLWGMKKQGKSFAEIEMPDTNVLRIKAQEVLFVFADIVIPAALGGQITRQNAERLKCRYLLEVANNPVMSDADEYVNPRATVIIPDIIANAGGITMSHFEWAQNKSGCLWTEEEARTRLDSRVKAVAESLINTSKVYNVSLEVASQMLALDNLGKAIASLYGRL